MIARKPRLRGEETMTMKPDHICVTSADVSGRFFFLPGSPTRARTIAEHFEGRVDYPSPRGHDVHTGVLRREGITIPVGVVASGMGCPSLGIIATELIGLGVSRLLRVGTAGSLQPSRVEPSHIVIATGAVRDEGASLAYCPAEFPAIASWQLVQAAQRAAASLLDASCIHLGVVHTKDSLYAREFGAGPLAAEHQRYRDLLRAMGVLASEMEAAHLFVLAQNATGSAWSTPPIARPESSAPQHHTEHHVQAGCVLAVVGDEHAFGDPQLRRLGEERAIQVALETAVVAESNVG